MAVGALLTSCCGGRTSLCNDAECTPWDAVLSGGSSAVGGASSVGGGSASRQVASGIGGHSISSRPSPGNGGTSSAGRSSATSGVRYDGKSPRFCSTDGWCGATVDFLAIWGTRADDVWIVARTNEDDPDPLLKSALLHWDGASWSNTEWQQSVWGEYSNIPYSELWGIWGARSDDIWVVGDAGMLVHFDGRTWREVDGPSRSDLVSVWGAAASDIWAVGEGGTILHYDGSQWADQSSPTTKNLRAVWGTAWNEVWAVGDSETILEFDGNDWRVSSSVPDSTRELRTVWGSQRADVWAVGSSGTTYHFDGNRWSIRHAEQALPNTMDAYALHGGATSALWAVGANGTIAYWSGASWIEDANTAEVTLRSVWANTADVWAVGDDATALHWNLYDGWRELTRATPKKLNAIWGSAADDVWAVGADIVHWDGLAWNRLEAPNDREYLCLWGSSATDLWAAGKAGALIHWNGKDFRRVDSGTSADLTGIWGDTSQDIWAGTSDGSLLHFDGNGWSTHTSGLAPVTALWGSNSSNVVAVGKDQRLHFDGARWSRLSDEDSGTWSSVFGGSGSDLWIGGSRGWSAYKAGGVSPVLDRWNGNDLIEQPDPKLPYTAVVAGWAKHDNDVWITLDWSGGYVMHWDGSEWTPTRVGCGDPIGKIWGTDSDIWVLGARGAILRLER